MTETIFDGWNDCRKPSLKSMSKIFFYSLYNCQKKMSNLYQRLMNVEVLLKTTEIYTHRCKLKHAYYFYSHALNQW